MNRHISEQFDAELNAAHQALMGMGGLVERQLDNACTALVTHDRDLALSVREQESRVNQFELELDDQCTTIIARRQPTASDLRVILGMLKSVTDLERIGDEANRIAKMALKIADLGTPADRYAEFRDLHHEIKSMLAESLDAFARQDAELAVRVIESDEAVDAHYGALVAHHTEHMRSNPQTLEHPLNVIWAARALERAGDHAKNICESVVYQVEGRDVRHPKLQQNAP
ncbi:MAG: phosphate signaling complex protein PhoU [Pseudomonadota bacterium]